MQKGDLEGLVVEALTELGGRGSIVDFARELWSQHEAELRASGDLFSLGNTTFAGQKSVSGTKTCCRWSSQRKDLFGF